MVEKPADPEADEPVGTPDNVLTCLHRWAWRQDENLVSDDFAFVLRHLLRYEHDSARRVIRALTDGVVSLDDAQVPWMGVTTQVSKEEGTPDIAIRCPDALVLVEVKVSWIVDKDQLRRYRELLDRSGSATKLLTLLTKSGDKESLHHKPDAWLAWADPAAVLEQLSLRKPSSDFLMKQFLGSLREERVGWELRQGVNALWYLHTMLGEAARELNADPEPTVGQQHAGWWLHNKQFWLGVYWDKPSTLVFETTDRVKLDEQTTRTLGRGDVREIGRGARRRIRWTISADLEGEDTHFLSRSKERQLLFVKSFLCESLSAVDTIRAK
ncbi:MAG: hypothetical protein ABIL25_00800 [candidate division WOR-3 bacterium]